MMRDDDEDDEEGERGQHNNNRPVGEVAERRERAHTIQEHSFHKGRLFYLCAERFEGTIGGCRERERCMCATAHKRAGDVESRRGCVAREEMWNDVDVLCGDFLVNVILVQKTRGALPATAHDRRH